MIILKVIALIWTLVVAGAAITLIFDKIRNQTTLVGTPPSMHPNCRCMVAPVYETKGRLLDDDELEVFGELDDLIREVERGG